MNAQPSGNPTPIAQPTATSLDACLAQCKGNSACVNYTFESNTCKLFSTQANTRRQAIGQYQKQSQAAEATPATGVQGTHDSPLNAEPTGNPTPIAQPTATSLDACLTQCKDNPTCVNYTFESNVCKLFGPTNTRRQASDKSPTAGAQTGGQVGTHDSPINAQPSGNPTPIEQPTSASLDACLASCKGNSACVNYTFESGVCKLFGATVSRRQQQGQQGGNTGAQPGNTGAQTGNQNGDNTATNPTTPASGSKGASAGTHASPVNQIPSGAPAPIATPAATDLDACLTQCKGNSACIAYTFESGVCKLFN